MADRDRLWAARALGAAVAGLALLSWGGPASPPAQQIFPDLPLEKPVAVAADAGWVDTGLDLGPGEEVHITASGEISLQRGNAEAVCGPAGIDLVTVDQPIPNANLGALIGKIAQPVARRVDEDSGVEVLDEIFVLFFVGPETDAAAPFKGRLYLGVNENVLRDNGGAYAVVVVRRPA
jgi:hypothetical protein